MFQAFAFMKNGVRQQIGEGRVGLISKTSGGAGSDGRGHFGVRGRVKEGSIHDSPLTGLHRAAQADF
jgi:hypothetical protein